MLYNKAGQSKVCLIFFGSLPLQQRIIEGVDNFFSDRRGKIAYFKNKGRIKIQPFLKHPVNM